MKGSLDICDVGSVGERWQKAFVKTNKWSVISSSNFYSTQNELKINTVLIQHSRYEA